MKPTVVRASMAYLARQPWQFLLSVLGVSIGVAVIIAVDLANASARTSFLQSMDAVTGSATHQIIGGSKGVDESIYVELRTRYGVDSIAPVIEGQARIAEQEFDLLGIDLFAEATMERFSSGLQGNATVFRDWLVVTGAIALGESRAAALGLNVGDTLELMVDGQRHLATLVGVFSTGQAASLETMLLTDIATAQEWLGTHGFLSRIDLRADASAQIERIASLLPHGNRLLDAEGRTRSTLDLSAAFMTNLQAMSLLALLVGVFLIYNSMSFSVLQRRHLIGLLRALGVTRGEVMLLILLEALLIGAVASVIGLLLGAMLGKELLWLVSRSINDLYFKISVTELSIEQMTLVKGLLAGVLTSLLAAFLPAIEASSFAPNRVLARSSVEASTGRLAPRAFAAGIALMLAALVVLLLSGRSLLAGLIAVFMLILGFALCVPFLVRLAAEQLAERSSGALTSMAIRGIAESLSRTGVAIVALTVAVSATIGVTLMVDSFRGSVSEWLDTALQADVYVSAMQGTIDPGLRREIVSLPSVENVSTSQRISLETESGRQRIQVLDLAPGAYAGTELLDGVAEDVWQRWETGNAVLISEPFAYRNQLGSGDRLVIPTDAGEVSFVVASRFQSFDVNATGIMMSRKTFNRHFLDRGVEALGLYLDAAADSDTLVEQLIALGEDTLQVNSNTRVRALSLEVFDQTFAITNVLYWLAIIVAIIGILSSMLALQLEKRREHGVLRALGSTPWQLAQIIETQTAVMGLMSGLAAIPLGIAMAFVLIEVINRRAFGWQIDLLVAPSTLLQAVLFATAAALVAGIYPAFRAATASPARAMRED